MYTKTPISRRFVNLLELEYTDAQNTRKTAWFADTNTPKSGVFSMDSELLFSKVFSKRRFSWFMLHIRVRSPLLPSCCPDMELSVRLCHALPHGSHMQNAAGNTFQTVLWTDRQWTSITSVSVKNALWFSLWMRKNKPVVRPVKPPPLDDGFIWWYNNGYSCPRTSPG